MAKKAGVWKIDGEERLSPKVHGDTPVLDVKLDGCARASDSVVMIDRIVAFKARNSGQEHPLLILKRVPKEGGCRHPDGRHFGGCTQAH